MAPFACQACCCSFFRSEAAICAALVLALLVPCAIGFGQSKEPAHAVPFDPVEFIKDFHIGMSYEDVQGLLPKTASQDALAYIPSEEAFLLGVDVPGQAAWSVSFKFDTLDTPARRPEQLIELERMGKKSAEKLVANIDRSRKNPLPRVLSGLGIPFVGERTAQILAVYRILRALRPRVR